MRNFYILKMFFCAVAFAFSSSSNAEQVRDPGLFTTALDAVFTLCPKALDGTVDFNKAAALAPYRLAPASAALERHMKIENLKLEFARAQFEDGVVLVGAATGKDCSVNISGSTKLLIHDAIIDRFVKAGGKPEPLKGTDEFKFRGFTFPDYHAGVLTYAEAIFIKLTVVPRGN